MQFVDAAHHRQIVRLGDGLGAVDPERATPTARIGGAPTGPCQTVRPSLFDRARSSTWPLAKKSRSPSVGRSWRKAWPSLVRAPPRHRRTARPSREQARDVVENLLLPGIHLVRMHPVPLRQFRNRRISRSASSAIFALNAASNFLRDFVIPRSVGWDRAGHFTP